MSLAGKSSLIGLTLTLILMPSSLTFPVYFSPLAVHPELKTFRPLSPFPRFGSSRSNDSCRTTPRLGPRRDFVFSPGFDSLRTEGQTIACPPVVHLWLLQHRFPAGHPPRITRRLFSDCRLFAYPRLVVMYGLLFFCLLFPQVFFV